MSLYIDNIIDSLAVIKEGRELSSCPRHFVQVQCGRSRHAREWIWRNLTGRFSTQPTFVAFEDPTEASMFGLVADQFGVYDSF
jgi:hypothetical protein